MSVKKSSSYIIILFITSMLFACGEDDSGAETMKKTTSPAPAAAPAMEKSASESMQKEVMGMDNGVIYQDEIYKNWPYQ